MAKRTVKFRLVTYFDEVDTSVHPSGDSVLVERTASLGEEIDLRKQDEDRLDSLGALYTKAEAKAISDGSYRGFDRELVFAAREGKFGGTPLVQPVEGEGSGDIDTMDAVALGEYIAENKLNVQNTLALLPEDATEEQISKLYDAENIATDNDPRAGVTSTLDAKLAAVAAQ